MVETMQHDITIAHLKGNLAEVSKMDAADPLAHLRQEFNIPQRKTSIL